MSIVYAPWTDEEVANLENWQKIGIVHPYTCVCGKILKPYRYGWHCNSCNYIQRWCHDFSLKVFEMPEYFSGYHIKIK